MAKSLVRIVCWECCHVTDLMMTALQAKKLEADIPKMKKVCPTCKPANKPITVTEGSTVLQQPKVYRCEHGHASLLAPLGDMIHIKFGQEDYVNVDVPLEELSNAIDAKDISCNHIVDGKQCDSKLTPIDDFKLERPSVNNIKTRLLVGDLWDRHGIEPVRPGHYNGQGDYKDSRSQQANKRRLEEMRRTRNTPTTRQPGQRIKNPTKTDYGHRDKSSLRPDRLE